MLCHFKGLGSFSLSLSVSLLLCVGVGGRSTKVRDGGTCIFQSGRGPCGCLSVCEPARPIYAYGSVETVPAHVYVSVNLLLSVECVSLGNAGVKKCADIWVCVWIEELPENCEIGKNVRGLRIVIFTTGKLLESPDDHLAGAASRLHGLHLSHRGISWLNNFVPQFPHFRQGSSQCGCEN